MISASEPIHVSNNAANVTFACPYLYSSVVSGMSDCMNVSSPSRVHEDVCYVNVKSHLTRNV